MKTKLKENEILALTIRKHWLVLLKPFLWTLVLLASIGGAYYKLYQSEYAEYSVYILLVAVPILTWFTYQIYDRRNNLWAITNLRVIDEYGVFSHNSKETSLDKINNISYHQSLLGRIFNYGDIQIQSAAESGAIIQDMLEKPKLLKETITQCQEEYKQEQFNEQAHRFVNAEEEEMQADKQSIYDEIVKLNDLKEKGIITEEEFQKAKDKLLNS